MSKQEILISLEEAYMKLGQAFAQLKWAEEHSAGILRSQINLVKVNLETAIYGEDLKSGLSMLLADVRGDQTWEEDLDQDEEEEEMFQFLDNLRASGECNMFESPRYLERNFNLSHESAVAVFIKWTEFREEEDRRHNTPPSEEDKKD